MALDSSAYVSHFRNNNPDRAHWSDDDVLSEMAYNAETSGEIKDHPVLQEYLQNKRLDERGGILKETGNAFLSGIDSMQAKLYDAGALVGDLTNIDSLKEWGDEGRERNEAEAAENAPLIQSFENVRSGRDLAYWLTGLVGTNAPQILGTVAAGAAAAAAAPAEGAIAAGAGAGALGVRLLSMIPGLAIRNAAGAVTGISTRALAQLAGTSAMGFTQMQNYGELSQAGGKNVIPLSIANGLIGAALESVGPISLLNRFTAAGERELIKDAAKNALMQAPGPILNAALALAKEGSTEALTEMAQESVSMVTEGLSQADNPEFKFDPEQVKSRLMNSGLAGFILGGGLGALAERGGSQAGGGSGVKQEVKTAAPSTTVRESLDVEVPPMAPVPVATPPVATPVVQTSVPVVQTPTAQPTAAPIPEVDHEKEINDFIAKNQEADQLRAAAKIPTPYDEESERILEESDARAEQARQQKIESSKSRLARLREQVSRERMRKYETEMLPGPEMPSVLKMHRAKQAAKVIAQEKKEMIPSRVKVESNAAAPQAPTMSPGVVAPINPVAESKPQVAQPPVVQPPAPVAPAPVAQAPAPAPFKFTKFVNAPDPALVTDLDAVQSFGGSKPHVAIELPDGSIEVVPVEKKTGRVSFPTVSDVHRAQTGEAKASLTTVRNYLEKSAPSKKPALAKYNEIQKLAKEIGYRAPSNKTFEEYAQEVGGKPVMVLSPDSLVARKFANEAEFKAAIDGVPFERTPGKRKHAVPGVKASFGLLAAVEMKLRELYSSPELNLTNLATQEAAAFKAALDEKGVTDRDKADYKEAFNVQSDRADSRTQRAMSIIAEAKKESQLAEIIKNAVEGLQKKSEGATPPSKPAGKDVTTPAPVDPVSRDVTTPAPVNSTEAFSNLQSAETFGELANFNIDNFAATTSKFPGPTERFLRNLAKSDPKNFIDVVRGRLEKLITNNNPTLAEQLDDGSFNELLVDVSTKLREAISNLPERADTVPNPDATTKKSRKEIKEEPEHRGEELDMYGRPTNESEVHNRFAPGTSESIDYNENYAQKLANLLTVARAMGVNVEFKQLTSRVKKAMGAYSPSRNLITVAMANVMNPTRQEFLTLKHEIIHAMSEEFPAHIREALHNWAEQSGPIKNASADPRVTVEQTESGLSEEAYRDELMTEKLTLLGADENVATGFIPAFWRTLKSVVLETAIYLQEALLGKSNTGGKLANAYAENLMRGLQGGDKGFLSQFTKRMPFTNLARVSGASMHIDNDGQVSYEDAEGGSLESLRFNLNKEVVAYDETAVLSGAADRAEAELAMLELAGADAKLRNTPTETALKETREVAIRKMVSRTRKFIAAQNQIDKVLRRSYEEFKKASPGTDKDVRADLRKSGLFAPENLTFESYVRRIGGRGTPESHVADAVESLKASLQLMKADVSDMAKYIDSKVTLETMPELERGEAIVEEYHPAIEKLFNRSGVVAHAVQKSLSKLELDQADYAKTVQEMSAKITDYQTTGAEAEKFIRQTLVDLRRDVRGLLKSGQAASEAQSIFNTLVAADKIRNKTADNFERAIDSVPVSGVSFASVFKALYGLEASNEIDLSITDPAEAKRIIAEEVARNPDSPLNVLVRIGDGENARLRGTALLTSLLSFFRKQGHINELIRLQLSQSADKAEAQIEVRNFLQAKTAGEMKAIQEKLKNTKRRSSAVVAKWVITLAEAESRLQSLENVRQQIAAIKHFAPIVSEMKARSESQYKFSSEINIGPGTRFYNPKSPDMTSEEVSAAPMFTLHLDVESWSKTEEFRGLLQRMDAWIANAKIHDRVYHNMVAMKRKITEVAAVAGSVGETLGGIRSGRNEGVADWMRNSGTPSGALAASRITFRDRLIYELKSSIEVYGQKVELARDKFLKRTKLTNDSVTSLFWDPIRRHVEKAYVSSEEAMEELRGFFKANPLTADIANDDTSWTLLMRWNAAAVDANEMMTEFQDEQGAKVLDEKIQQVNPQTGKLQAILRAPVERGGLKGQTFTRRLSNTIHAAVGTIPNWEKILGDGPENPLRDFGTRLASDPEEAMNRLKAFCTPMVMDQLVIPLLTQTNVVAPKRVDGVDYSTPHETLARLWDAANGDIVGFLKGVHQELSDTFGVVEVKGQMVPVVSEDLTSFLDRTMDRVSDRLHKLAKDTAEAQAGEATITGLARYGLDARHATLYPDTWFTYSQNTTEDLRLRSYSLANNIAFGANYSDLTPLLNDTHAELKAAASKIEGLNANERKALAKKDPEGFKKALAAEEAIKAGRSSGAAMLEAVSKSLNADAITAIDPGLLYDIFGAVVSTLTSGLKGGIKNLFSGADHLLLTKSISPRSLMLVGRSYGHLGANMAASMLSMFGVDAGRHSRIMQNARQFGLFDSSAHLTAEEQLAGHHGRNASLDGSFRGGLQRFLRRARVLTSNVRVGAGKGNSAIANRANPFQMGQLHSTFSAFSGFIEEIEYIGRLAAKFYASNGDTTAELSAKAIGYPDQAMFDNIKSECQMFGISLEDIGARAMKAGPGKEFLNKSDYSAIFTLVQTRVIGEGNLSSRAMWMQQSQFAKINSTFVGWSFWKAARVFKLFETPEGQHTFKSMMRGMTVMGLGVLPMGIAFSILLDEYDRELLGKKSNIRPLSLDDAYASVLERMMTVGSLGIAGDVLDTATNIARGTTGNTLSVDSRIVWVNSVLGLAKAGSDLIAMGGLENANYANFYRRVGQSFGLGGLTQNLVVASRVLGLDEMPVISDILEPETSVLSRTNVQNWLRAAGRNLDMEIRSYGGSSTPNAVTPWATEMVLAAMRNDPAEFNRAAKKAWKAAEKMGKSDPGAYVKEAFQSRHPLRSVFRINPSQDEVARLMAELPPDGRAAVQSAISLMNRYGTILGVKPYTGSEGSNSRTVKKKARTSAEWASILAQRRMGELDSGI